MNKRAANEEAKKVYEKWLLRRKTIERKAKENGDWNEFGLDANTHLFSQIDKEAVEKLKQINADIDESDTM